MGDRPATRVCRDCGVEKPLDGEHFTPSAGSAWGFRRQCKACRNAATAQRRLNDWTYAERANSAQRRAWRTMTPERRAARYAYMRAYNRRKAAVDTAAPSF